MFSVGERLAPTETDFATQNQLHLCKAQTSLHSNFTWRSQTSPHRKVPSRLAKRLPPGGSWLQSRLRENAIEPHTTRQWYTHQCYTQSPSVSLRSTPPSRREAIGRSKPLPYRHSVPYQYRTPSHIYNIQTMCVTPKNIIFSPHQFLGYLIVIVFVHSILCARSCGVRISARYHTYTDGGYDL